MNKRSIFVLYGGRSAEHEVSLMSAQNIISQLNRDKYTVYPVYITAQGVFRTGDAIPGAVDSPDALRLTGKDNDTPSGSLAAFLRLVNETENAFLFPALHGTYGEDGTIQGLFEMTGLPYVGAGVLASAAGMDKIVMKNLFASAGIPQSQFVSFSHSRWTTEEEACFAQALDTIGLPAYVKPANLGSSVGISRAATADELRAAMKLAFRYDRRILVEQEIKGREIILAMRGNDDIACSKCGEWQRAATFFDFEDKYLDDGLTPKIPAAITDEQYRLICEYGRAAYRAIDCAGLARGDFFVTDEGEIYLNELNTLPGFTSHSMYPLLWERSDGMAYTELLDALIALGLERFAETQAINYSKVD